MVFFEKQIFNPNESLYTFSDISRLADRVNELILRSEPKEFVVEVNSIAELKIALESFYLKIRHSQEDELDQEEKEEIQAVLRHENAHANVGSFLGLNQDEVSYRIRVIVVQDAEGNMSCGITPSFNGGDRYKEWIESFDPESILKDGLVSSAPGWYDDGKMSPSDVMKVEMLLAKDPSIVSNIRDYIVGYQKGGFLIEDLVDYV